MLAPPDRRAFRIHALDGAALYFQPTTGIQVRIATAATAALRRQAPRVAMFGITNACNLACAFCSRDLARPSTWTVATAAAALRGLHTAGTLEVAYGGGEPFAFRGFAELVAELDATTALAQHVTTNGTLITAATWPRFAGRFGQVRISIYDDAWRAPAAILAAHGQRWGANLIVDAAALAALPAQLAALAAAGCHDLSLLAYVGPERARHLEAPGRARLAAIIADSPVACRLSVCFGDRVPAPRLLDDGDCGAGRDFISITPDQRVQSCSFQDRSFAGATADEILAAWRMQQPHLAAPSPRLGCARALPLATAPAPPPPIAIWQGFSGNNSGECVMVAKFHDVADAEAYLAELVPGWTPEQAPPPAWRQLFMDEGVVAATTVPRDFDGAETPRELLAIGRSVIAIQYDSGDAFPELRGLAWKRGAFVVPGGVHVHDGLNLLAAIRTANSADRDRVLAVPRHRDTRVHVHGDLVLLALPVLGRGQLETLAEGKDELERIAGDRPLAAEVCFDGLTDAALIAAMQRLGHRPPRQPRLWLSFWHGDGGADAAAFARMIDDGRATHTGSAVLVDPAPDRKRLAVLGYRHGAAVMALDGPRLVLTAMPWYLDPPRQKGVRAERRVVDPAQFEAALRAQLPRAAELELPADGGYSGPRARIITDEPAAVMAILGAYAASIDARLSIWAEEPDAVAQTLRRVVEDLGR
jgi:hypothetical protein